MDVNSFLFLLIIGWFFLIGIHIALVREKSVAGCLYGIISCIFHIPMLLAMPGYFPPPSALNDYMGIMAYLFIPASFLMMPIVFILIIVTLIKAPESRPTVPLFEMDAEEPQFDINSELIDAVVNDDIALVKKLVLR